MEQQTIRIMAEPQMDPNKCKFVTDRILVKEGTYKFGNTNEAKGSILAENILEIENIENIMIGGNTVWVTKKPGKEDWRQLGPKIGQAIRSSIGLGKPLVDQTLKEKFSNTDEIKQKVEQVLKEKVNPQVASHGGFIELVDVKFNDIYIKMGGGCQGCASSQATLKQGVEQTLRNEIPELGTIHDATDHAAGANPYH